MRADEHEGDLNNTEVKRQHDRVEARSTQILRSDIAELTEAGAFLRWYGKYLFPVLMQDFPVNNGSLLAQFMGRRQLALQIKEEMDLHSPGFINRVMAARMDYERELEMAALGPQREN